MEEILGAVTASLQGFPLLKVALLCFVVLMFFLLREFFTWYWKQNEICELLRKIEENTRK
jgi:hypothetical protein